jgi:hypothetical protein
MPSNRASRDSRKRPVIYLRLLEYMGMDLERGLSTKEWPYVYHMKAS